MAFRAALLISALAGTLAAQYGTRPKASAGEYPAHAKVEPLTIGAEYLVHSFSNGRQVYIAKDYLVVEVALFPVKGQRLEMADWQFALRINRRKQTIAPQAPEIVANAVKYPDQSIPSDVQGVAQVGPVVFGPPQPAERFPGDPTVRTGPPPPKGPMDEPNGLDKEPPVKADELVVEAALPEGERRDPTSGFLYFPYRGKVGRIHSLELIVGGPAGGATLPLPLE